VRIKFGSRIFAPRPFTTVLAIAMIIVLVSLGRWQLRRADQKRALYDAFDRGADATRVIDRDTPLLPRYQHIEAHGSYDESRQILIDNMTDSDGHAGYFVITPLALTGGGWLLVNRGWVPVGRSRAELPAVGVAGNVRTVDGRADHLPSPGIRMGPRIELRPPYPAVANFPGHADIERLMHEGSWAGATEVLLLDADQSDGYLRRWQAPGLPPLRHLAYAVQWFGLALALGVIYIVTNMRPDPDRNAAA
jgi:surfeit locus 1 family protein